MDHLKAALLESWDRQSKIIDNILANLNDTTKESKPAPEGWPIYHHLCHIHLVRSEWLKAASPKHAEGLAVLYVEQDEQWIPIPDLKLIGDQLALSARAIRDLMEESLDNEVTSLPPYDHPVLFLQHQVWHEGYHAGLIFLALRNVGAEPSDEWYETNVWELWRGPEEW